MSGRFSFLLTGAILLAALPATGQGTPDSAHKDFAARLAAAALERTTRKVIYDPAYVRLAYPMGDVPDGRGVCTDVIIRSYRALNIDLQKLVHEDMRRAFSRYPKLWGLKATDRNIDHRRVPNLRVFFARHGTSLPVSRDARSYLPGDIISWRLGNGLPHIGIVSMKRTRDGARPLIIHNIGAGTTIEDMIFDYKITGHYRYQRTPNRP